MDTNNDKEDRYKKWRRDRDQESKVLDQLRNPRTKLKLVIVTLKLLAGFDAPILQVMYLDKSMKDHTLLQAICRTNRVYGHDKSNGLIIDYVGIFDDVAKALDFDEKNVQSVITNIEAVKFEIPRLIKKCLEHISLVLAGLLKAGKASLQHKTVSPDPFLKDYIFDNKWIKGL